MKLFHWNAMESSQLYTYGDLIVMAETVDDARKKAMEYFENHATNIGYSDVKELRKSIAGEPSAFTESDKDQLDRLTAAFKADIQKEPVEVEYGVVSCNGGE